MMPHALVMCEIKNVDLAQVIIETIPSFTMRAELPPQHERGKFWHRSSNSTNASSCAACCINNRTKPSATVPISWPVDTTSCSKNVLPASVHTRSPACSIARKRQRKWTRPGVPKRAAARFRPCSHARHSAKSTLSLSLQPWEAQGANSPHRHTSTLSTVILVTAFPWS